MLQIVFAVIAVLAPAGTSPSSASVLASVQKYYGGAKQLTTKFEQTVVNPAYGTTQKSSGKVYLVSPDKMRWDYDAKKGSARRAATCCRPRCRSRRAPRS